MSRRTIAIITATEGVLAGMLTTYAVPAIEFADLWFAAHEGKALGGLLLGLLLTLLGTSIALPFSQPPRRKRRSRTT
jgi:hypothetical protein